MAYIVHFADGKATLDSGTLGNRGPVVVDGLLANSYMLGSAACIHATHRNVHRACSRTSFSRIPCGLPPLGLARVSIAVEHHVREEYAYLGYVHLVVCSELSFGHCCHFFL